MKLPNSWDKFDINEYQSKNLNEAKEYKAGDTVKLKTGETVKINQVVKGPRPQFNTYRTKVKGKQVDFGTKDIHEGRLNEAPMDRGLKLGMIPTILRERFHVATSSCNAH